MNSMEKQLLWLSLLEHNYPRLGDESPFAPRTGSIRPLLNRQYITCVYYVLDKRSFTKLYIGQSKNIMVGLEYVTEFRFVNFTVKTLSDKLANSEQSACKYFSLV